MCVRWLKVQYADDDLSVSDVSQMFLIIKKLLKWCGHWVMHLRLLWGVVFLVATVLLWKSVSKEHSIFANTHLDEEIFGLQDLKIFGRRYTSIKEICSILSMCDGAMRVDKRVLLAIQAAEIKTKLEALPWVALARVRVLDSITIVLTEHEPSALWDDGKKLWLIDRGGRTIALAKEREKWPKLTIVRGEGAKNKSSEALRYKRLLDKQNISLKISGFRYVGERRWDIEMKNGVLIMLPEGEEAYKELEFFLLSDMKDILFDQSLQRLDLRLSNKIFIRF